MSDKEYVFTTKDFLEELTTTHSERSEFLRTKLSKRTIGDVEANLYRYRLDRLKAVGAFIRSIYEEEKAARRAAQSNPEPSGSAPAPKPEPAIPIAEPAVDQPAPAALSAPVSNDVIDDGFDDV